MKRQRRNDTLWDDEGQHLAQNESHRCHQHDKQETSPTKQRSETSRLVWALYTPTHQFSKSGIRMDLARCPADLAEGMIIITWENFIHITDHRILIAAANIA